MTFTPRASVLSASLSLLAGTLIAGCEVSRCTVETHGETMGTSYSVRVTECIEDTEFSDAVKDRLREMNASLSHYDPQSELSTFNRYAGSDWQPVSADLANVVQLAIETSEFTDGAFDVTVAAAVNAWGFGPDEIKASAPDDSVVKTALMQTGWRKLGAAQNPPAIRKLEPDRQIDLSAIAKGYAVDQLAYLLEFNGYTDYLVEIGGEVRAAGLRQDGTPWRIGIQPPDASPDIEFVVTPGDLALATSGDYRNFRIVAGERFSHTIDPQTAAPVASGFASVTVIDPLASRADALATALMVMGPGKAVDFARDNNIPALFIVRDGETMQPVVSAAFEPFLAKD